jgi:Dolichyl-phosphate-mannose-protein mannosyltransferase
MERTAGDKLAFASVGAALLTSVAGQWILAGEKNIPAGLLLYGISIGFLLFGLGREPLPIPARLIASVQTASRPRWILASASILCALLAFTLNTDTSFAIEGVPEYQFTLIGVLAWFASIFLFLAAFWQPEKTAADWRDAISDRLSAWRNGFSFHLSWTGVALIAVLALGLVFYFYHLDMVPAEMTSDHVEKLLDINDVLHGHYPVFFIRNTGREPFQFYVTTAIIKLAGVPLSHMALKIGTALIGFLTIPVTFLLAREMFDATVGVLAAFFMAVSHWSVAISRMGLRFPYTPLFVALSFYFLWRALKYQKRNDYLIAGLVIGFGLYGYIPSRNIPLVALAWCVAWFVFGGWQQIDNRWSFIANVGLMLALLLIVFAPLLRYSLDFPEEFWYRALTRVSSTERPIAGNILAIFGQNLINLALAFNWRGDSVWTVNIPYQPFLDVMSGAFLVLGTAIAIFRWFRSQSIAYLLLLGATVALVLPSALSIAFPIENPSMVRMGGAIPFMAILLALPVAFLWTTIRPSFTNFSAGALGVAVIIVLLAPIVLMNYQWYFSDFDLSYRESSENSTEIAGVMRDFASSIGDPQHVYNVSHPYWVDGRAIAINLGNIEWHNFSLNAADLLTDDNANLLYTLNPSDKRNLAILERRYPTGQIKTFHSRTPGKDFLEFFVPASATR